MTRTILVSLVVAASLTGCMSEGERTFFKNVERNDLVEVEADLREHPSYLESRNEIGCTPLCFIAYRGIPTRGTWRKKREREVVDYLIAQGADVNAADQFGRAPLYWFASHGDTEMMKIVIARGARVNECDKYDNTPLHIAAGNAKVEACKLLLAHGAEVNARGKDNQTPLTLAIRSQHEDLPTILRQHGATK
jgi:ankyrin repeat protein